MPATVIDPKYVAGTTTVNADGTTSKSSGGLGGQPAAQPAAPTKPLTAYENLNGAGAVDNRVNPMTPAEQYRAQYADLAEGWKGLSGDALTKMAEAHYAANGYAEGRTYPGQTIAPPKEPLAAAQIPMGSGSTATQAGTASAGLINAAPESTNTAIVGAAPAVATQATGTGYTSTNIAAPTTLTPDRKATVAGQVEDIINKNSPLSQLATARANEQANNRGLINSSMAVGEGQKALYDSALPMATQDANTFYNAQGQTYAATNAANTANAGATNAASQFGAAATNAASTTNASLGTQTSINNQSQSNQIATQNAANSNQSSQFNQGQANTIAATNAANALSASKTNAEAANALQAQQIQQQTQVNIANLSAANQTAIAQFDASVKTALNTADRATQVEIQNLADASKAKLAQAAQDNASALQVSASAQAMYTNFTSALAGIMSATNTFATPAVQKTAMDNLAATLNSGLTFIGKVNGIEGLNEKLTFT